MTLLHDKTYRRLCGFFFTCGFGLLMMYLCAAPRTNVLACDAPQETPQLPKQTQEEEPQTPHANYYVKRTQGLSREEERLVLERPLELKTSVEYLAQQPSTLVHQKQEELDEVMRLLNDAKRLPDESRVIALSTMEPITLTLAYEDGYACLYVYQGYSEKSKKPVTLIHDNLDRMYQTKASAAQGIYELAKPVITSLDAKKVNIYSTKHLRKSTLQAQLTKEEEHKPFLLMLNSLSRQGLSEELGPPDYLVCTVGHGRFEEEEQWYLWTREKKVLMAFAKDPDVIYRADELSSRSLRKHIKKYSVKS